MSDRDRLIELIKNAEYESLKYEMANKFYPFDDYKSRSEFIADYLLENGVIVPPCKVGDTVYVVSQGQGFCMRWNVYEGKVVDIHLNRHNKLTIRVENGEKFFGYFEPCFIFLTKEEAEEKLKEREKVETCQDT